jgi:mevalonate kinase
MPAISATAPGKVILFGEHAVVYGRPAIAIPVTQVKAKAVVTANPRGAPGEVRVQAPDVGLESMLEELDPAQPLAAAIQGVASALKVKRLPACTVKITSTIPVAAGMGSGAAVSVALIRALSAFLGHPLSDEKVSVLAFEIEKIHHGTPSGIDNTVITFARPVYFVKGKPIETLQVGRSFTIVIGDTGIASPTAAAVGEVRKAWQSDKPQYEAYFESVGAIAQAARQAVENGGIELLGPLMDANHGVLGKMAVSCAELDALVIAARKAGAWGAKLSGGGRGGNMIALVPPARAEGVAKALQAAGAVRTIVAQVKLIKCGFRNFGGI